MGAGDGDSGRQRGEETGTETEAGTETETATQARYRVSDVMYKLLGVRCPGSSLVHLDLFPPFTSELITQ